MINMEKRVTNSTPGDKAYHNYSESQDPIITTYLKQKTLMESVITLQPISAIVQRPNARALKKSVITETQSATTVIVVLIAIVLHQVNLIVHSQHLSHCHVTTILLPINVILSLLNQ